jgi:hypothetical protein
MYKFLKPFEKLSEAYDRHDRGAGIGKYRAQEFCAAIRTPTFSVVSSKFCLLSRRRICWQMNKRFSRDSRRKKMTGETPGHGAGMGVVALIFDILRDIQKLAWQEIRLAKHELRQEIRKTLTTLLSFVAGMALALVGALLLVLMLVHLINALTELPLWACYGIVAGIFTAIGILLVVFGMKALKQLRIIPAQTIQTVKENVRWFKEIAMSGRM